MASPETERKFEQVRNEFDAVYEKLDELKAGQDVIVTRLGALDERFDTQGERLDRLAGEVAGLDRRVERRLVAQSERLDAQSAKLDAQDAKLDTILKVLRGELPTG